MYPVIFRERISRREFMGHGIAGAVSGTSAFATFAASQNESGPSQIIDTHTHFYDPTRPQSVPWPEKTDKFLYRRILPDDYKALARPHGVTGTVVVEASAWIEDNQWVLDLAAKEPFIVGLVGHLTPGRDEFAGQLKHFARNPLFRGIRISGGQLGKELDQPNFIADLKRLAEFDLELDVNGGTNVLSNVAWLGKQIPALRIVINHVANVRIDGKTPPKDWLEGMHSAAGQRNVFCKVSGLVEGSGAVEGKAPTAAEFYQPVLDAVWNAFGEDRLIYGSNWPVSERFASYATVQRIVSDYFRAKGKAASEKYFWRNALAVYKWVKR
jgi:L-fucono-1,5-lactonase